MKTVTVRAPGCGGDNFTAFRNNISRTGRELEVGESATIEFDPTEFPFAPAVLESLLRGASLTLIEDRQDAGLRALVVERT